MGFAALDFRIVTSRDALRYRIQNLQFQSLIVFVTLQNGVHPFAEQLLVYVPGGNMVAYVFRFADKFPTLRK